MKIIDENILTDIEISIQKKQEHEYTLLGKYKPKIDGYRIFEYNPKTKEIKEANLKDNDVFVIGKENKRRIDIEQGMYYIEALNKKNALKRLLRGDIFFKS